MNNLLRTLTQTGVTNDLRLLLTTVKDGLKESYKDASGRSVETRDQSFYEALDDVLTELRMVTLDNHDAEAFLRPVLRSEVPDYHQVIAHPMDFQTMQRKVKQKQYKTKAEFNADLELIWRNCYTYNAVEGHHLRKCVDRLKVKAQRLLANVTDRKERTDPPIPAPKPTKLPNLKLPLHALGRSGPTTFQDMPALTRTPEGMATFLKMEMGVVDDSTEGERPRKRIKLDHNEQSIDAWWSTVREPEWLNNGLPPSLSSSRLRRKKRKPPIVSTNSESGLLKLMNNNIRTIKRVRRTHTKFTALTDDIPEEEDDEVDEAEECGWSAEGPIGQESADQCLGWMDRKVLEHSGFQGTSQSALDVLTGVTSEYLYNVGRTMRFMSDKYGHTMTPEEIILHTLFESGVTRIQDLERYIKDDVERHGARLGELEKKLVGAYREATSGGVELEDEGLFEDEDEDEAGVLALGDFADSLGMDYLGLRELGIADELGMTNLTIPKKLLRGKRRANIANAPVRPASPPPPYPPPAPFVPLVSSRLDDQIGLLRDRYRQKLLPQYPTMLDSNGQPLVRNAPDKDKDKDEDLAEDQPAQQQVRMGPLGQIAGSLKGGAPKKSGGGGEKKKGGGPGKKKKALDAAAAQQAGVIVAKA